MRDKPYRVHSVKKRGRRWLWIGLGSLAVLIVIVGGLALGYYLWLDAKVSAANDRVSEDVLQALADDPTTLSVQTTVMSETPDAMNILILGSDTRSDTIEGSRSDTVMLLHVDPSENYMSMLSLPRDLRVDIEPYGANKLNFAYATGGAALTIKIVQQITGVDIDHVLQIDFAAFKQMTDMLGGVYVEVDRRYYYAGEDYERIHLEPGYRLLNGADALDFVRYRHDLNADFGRMARQQRFLSALRQQAMGWDLAFNLPGLVRAFFDNVTTDITTNEFLKLAIWGIKLDGARIRQVALRGYNRLSGGVTLVFWDQEDMDAAVRSLLTPPGAEYAYGDDGAGPSTSVATSTTVKAPTLPEGATPESIPDHTIWKRVAGMASIPIEAPAYIAKGYRIATRSKTYAYMYDIEAGGDVFPTVVMLYHNTGIGRAGEVKLEEEYINVTATTWLDAPVASPGAQVRYNGNIFNIVGTADAVERVWWKSNNVLYWVSNSLSRVASDAELLAMAQSMIPIPAQ